MGHGNKIQDVRASEKIVDTVEQALLQRDVAKAFITPGEGGNNRNPEVRLSQLTVKSDTSMDKDGHIVTTETRGDGSTHTSTQEIGKDNKLHLLSIEVRDVHGVSIEKFDPLTSSLSSPALHEQTGLTAQSMR
jgi:hypothetical protein